MSNETYHESYQNLAGSTTQAQQPSQTAWAAGQSNTQTLQQNALYRHPTEKLVGGVCGGIAAYFGWDPALVRILWLVATIGTGGGGLLAYAVLWGLLPVGTRQGGVQQPATFALNERNIGRVATALIVLGGIWLLTNVGILPRMWFIFWALFRLFFWPALLIGVGYMLLKGSGNANVQFNLGDLRDRVRNRVRDVRLPTIDSAGIKSNLESSRQRLSLRRSTTDRLFLGVCGGIAKRVGVDANLVRLLWAAFSVGSIGMGVLIYLVVGFILPEEDANGLAQQQSVQNVEIIEGSKPQAV